MPLSDPTPTPENELIPLTTPEEDTPETQLLRELLPPMSEDQERDLFATAMSEYHASLEDRADWEANLATWEQQYLGILPDKQFPWPGCANFHVPLTMLGVETLKPRLVEAVLGEDPIVLAIPTEPNDEESRDRVETLLNWQALSQMRVTPLVEESAHLFLNPGTVVGKVTWDVERRVTKRIAVFPPDTPPDRMWRGLFGEDVPELTQRSATEWRGEVKTKNGAPRSVRLKLNIMPDEIQVLIEREEVRYEGPRVRLVPIEDFIVPYKGGGDIQKLPWCKERLWLTEADLRSNVARGRFSKDAVKALLGEESPAGDNAQQDTREYRDLKTTSEGVTDVPATSVRDEQYEVLENYACWDLDEDGYAEELIYWTTQQLPDRILGWDYLDNVYAHGKRPYVKGCYLSLPDRFYGLSFAEVIRGLQEEINTIHNQRVDAGTLQNTPSYFYRASSSHSSMKYRITPGVGIPIDNPQQDVQIVQWGGSPVFGQNEESLLYQYFERLTGLTDLALGRQPNRVGATRTATGVASLLSEAGLRFKTAMQAFQRFWVDIFEHILALDQQYLPPGVEFRVTGRHPERIRIADRSEILGRYDLRLSATTETLNREVMRQDATVKLNAAMNPVLLQGGLIGLKGLYRLTKQFYRAYGETDPDLVVDPPRMEIVYSPEQELAMFLEGHNHEPAMAENLALHYETHMQQLQDPMVQEQLGPEGVTLLTTHIAKTQQLMQMQMMAQMMAQSGGKGAPVAGEQAMNAQTGKQAGQGPQEPAGFGGGMMSPQGMMQ